MKLLRNVVLWASLMLIFAISASAQLTGTKNIPGDYATLAAAVTDLNTQGVGAGGVTFNLVAANPQTAPTGGYVIGGTGSVVLTTASAANPIVFVGNGNSITAPTPQTSGNLNDAIFKLTGADWTTIGGFTMLENPANTTTAAGTNNMTEWGVALLYVTATDGAQNNTITGNTIDLDRTYQNTFGIYSNSTHSATAPTTSATATGAAGGNSNLTITANNITDVNNGITVIGPTAAADNNDGLTIGGSAPNANTLTNYGTTATFSSYANVSGTVNGILVRNTKNFNVSFNSITSSAGGVTSGTLNGIQVPAFSNAPTGTFTNSINNNTLSLQSGLIAGAINGINVGGTSASVTSTININNNDFISFGHTVPGTGAIIFINQSGTHLNQSISNNTFTNMTVNTTGSVTFIVNSNTLPSTGVKNVNNNSVLTLFNKTGAGGTVLFFSDNGSDPVGTTNNVNNNNFSNITVAGLTIVTGISNTNGGAPNKNVTGNTISNITGGTSIVTGITTNFDGGTTNVSNNNLNNITNGSNINGILFGTSGSGGALTSNVSQNTVHSLTGSASGAVIGISVGGTTGHIKNILRNKIYDISNTNVSGSASGITVSSGVTINLQNNLVGNITAPNVSGTNSLFGINISGGTTVNADFNTVYLNATSAGANFGSTALNASSTPNVTLRNNILANLSTPAGTGLTVAYRRSSTTLTSYNAASNNNSLYAGTPSVTNLIFNDGTNSDQTLVQFKARVASRDSSSVTENPPFLSTTGSSANFLHINSAIATQIESGGVTVAGITLDFDGDTRNVTTPDIGADEGVFTVLDLIGPNITYTNLLNTSSTANRVLTVTLTDFTGVATGGVAPRIYYNKNAGAYSSTACSLGSGTVQNGTWNCTINNADLGGVAVTDVVRYFVVAQDTLGNLSANPSGGFMGTDVNTVTTPPTTPNQYSIVAAISGTFNVGSAETYTSLTNAGGLFEFINNSEVVGNITVSITSDLAGELGTNALNQFASPHTILIRPSGAARSITGTTSANAMIRTNGASRVTIDGSLSGGTDRSLTIENTSVTTPQVVRFNSNGSAAISNNTLKNSIVRNGINTSSAVVVLDTAGSAGTFNNITIQNNDIQKAFIGIFTNATVLAGNGSNLLITQNKLDNTGVNAIRNIGVYVQGADGATVSNNMIGNLNNVDGENDYGIWLATGAVNTTVSNNSVTALGYTGTGAFAPFGIRDSVGAAASGNNIIGNTVSNISTNGTTAVYGIENSSGGTIIQKNNVQGVINTSTSTYGAYGVNITAGNNVVVRNNFISNVSHNMTGGGAFSTTFGVFGLRVLAGTGHQIYNNSVNLYGALPGTSTSSLLSAAFAIVSTTSTGMDVRNNAFANNITGGTTSISQVSVYLPSGGTSAMNLTMNNNAYFFGSDVLRQGTGQAGTTAGANFYTSLATLVAYSSTLHVAATNDNVSQAITTAVPFVSNNDLHLNDPMSPLLSAGATIGSVTNDFDMDPRPASTPDIGADEVIQATASSFPAGTYYNAIAAANDVLLGDVTITNKLTLTGIVSAGSNTLTLGCDATVVGGGANNYVIGKFAKQFCATTGSPFEYPIGSVPDGSLAGEEYTPFTANVTAINVIPSTLTVSVTDAFLPNSSTTQSASRFWSVTETGDLTADITYTYLDISPGYDVNGTESDYKVLRFESGTTAVYPGGTVNEATNTATAPGVSNFSHWAAGNLSPSAANVIVGGRVLTSSGRGILGARIVMNDSAGNTRMAMSNPFGYYRFDNVGAGETYVFSAFHKQYQFVEPSIVSTVDDNITNMNFVASDVFNRVNPNQTYFDKAPFDFDGDGISDASIWRAANNSWYIKRSSDNTWYSQEFGVVTDKLAPADYDGDGRTDFAVFRPSEGKWYIRLSHSNSLRVETFGVKGDVPMPSDFDGDGKADLAVWRSGKKVIIVKQSSDSNTFEQMFDDITEQIIPRIGDYNGDGKADFAIFKSESRTWEIRFSKSDKRIELEFEGTGDMPLFADFDGDAKSDIGFYNSETGIWTVKLSRTNETIIVHIGGSKDIPVLGDFDGDGKIDISVYQEGNWSIRQSVTNEIRNKEFGLPTDQAIPSIYVQ